MSKTRFSKNFKTERAYDKWNKAHKEFNIPFSPNAVEGTSISLADCTEQEVHAVAGYIVRNQERKHGHDIWLNGWTGDGGEE